MAGESAALPRWPVWQFLRDELTVSPARWSMMVRITVLVAIVTIVSNALRVPSLAVSAYLIIFGVGADVATTLRTGIGAVVAVTIALVLTFLVYLVTLNEPALRVPAMACCTFAAMYLMRTSKLGPLLFLVGFIASYALTFPDRGASPEQLTRSLLWVWAWLAYPLGLLVLADVVLGRRPAAVFREEVAERLQAAADFLAAPVGEESMARRSVERFGRAGTATLAPYVSAGPPAGATARAAILRQVDLLLLLLRELPEDAKRLAGTQEVLARASDACLTARKALLGEDPVPPDAFANLEAQAPAGGASPPDVLAVVGPLLACVKDLGMAILEARHPAAPGTAAKPESHPSATPLQKTEAAQFAIKVTIAVMAAYIIFNSLDWSGIHTAMITCFFVAQASLGATIHKLTLRLTGAAIGAAIGILSIVFILPQLETIGGLVVLIAIVTLFAAWISTGSQAISYAGMQVALAFYLTVLQGFTRTSKMVVGRDRVIGILLGNVIMSVVFNSLWPVRIKPAIRQALSRAVEALAAVMRIGTAGQPGLREAEIGFRTHLQTAAQYTPARVMEPGEDSGSLIPAIESLFVRIHAIVHQRVDLKGLPPAAAEGLSTASESVAKWLSDFAASLASSRATPAFQPAASAIVKVEDAAGSAGAGDGSAATLRLRADWFGLLDAQIERLAARESALRADEAAS
jgi:multidrug resistance protein MdtO